MLQANHGGPLFYRPFDNPLTRNEKDTLGGEKVPFRSLETRGKHTVSLPTIANINKF